MGVLAIGNLTVMSAAGRIAPEVRSEVGRLRTVMLHRPGSELKRLTPRNNDALLFDGLPWVDRAQQEHDGFAETLRSRGVEVLYLGELLIETLAQPGRTRAEPSKTRSQTSGWRIRCVDFCGAFSLILSPRSSPRS